MRTPRLLWGGGLLALPALLAWPRQAPTLPNAAIVAAQPVVAPACAAATGLARVVCLAEAFKATLGPAQLAEAQRPYSPADAARCSNFPQQFSRPQRVGVALGAHGPAVSGGQGAAGRRAGDRRAQRGLRRADR